MSTLQLYLNTIRRMTPGMIVSRVCGGKRLPDDVLSKRSGCFEVPPIARFELDCDSRVAARFDIDALADNEFVIINERHSINLALWNEPSASHLWNFNLHYFEYCVPLAARFNACGDIEDWYLFQRLVSSWMDVCDYPAGDPWHPYTISLRLINWLICLDLFRDAWGEDDPFISRMADSIYIQYRHLLINQETHLLANHYFENLKTLLVCAAVFKERAIYEKVLVDFDRQLKEQILSDGVHFERSLMYHKLVLEGLLRVELSSCWAGWPLPECLEAKEQMMLDAMASLEYGMGKTPFFNDAADGVAKESDQLLSAFRAVKGFIADDSRVEFPDAGYYKLYDGNIALMFDAGDPGPSYMLGHAHCDCLSFEVSIAGDPVIVNSGTYAYQSELRQYFRSTAAHNTVSVNGEEQLECWSEHRVARGYRIIDVTRCNGSSVCASMVFPSGRWVHRELVLRNGSLKVTDRVNSAAEITNYIHFADNINSRSIPFVRILSKCVSKAESNALSSCRFNQLLDSRLLTFKTCHTRQLEYSIDFEEENYNG